MDIETKRHLKEKWRKFLDENPRWKRTINQHYYFRTRYSSKFWINEINNILKKENELKN